MVQSDAEDDEKRKLERKKNVDTSYINPCKMKKCWKAKKIVVCIHKIIHFLNRSVQVRLEVTLDFF